jgi:hypothetical protein
MDKDQPALLQYDTFSLDSIKEEKYSSLRSLVFQSLTEFECSRSAHLEKFARTQVTRHELHGHSRTYVLVTLAEDDILDVAAFFTVGIATLNFEAMSGSMKKKLSGDFSSNLVGAFAIAELARSDKYSAKQLPGSVILDEAKRVVLGARTYIGGRYLVVDCQPKIFETLYAPAGFRRIQVAKAPRGMEDKDFISAACLIRDW